MVLHDFVISCFSYLSLQTFKSGLYGIDFLMAEICHEELGTPGGVPCTEDIECFLYGCSRFILDDKRAYHHKMDVGLHHKKEKWKLILHCFVGSIQEGDFVTITAH